MVMGSLVGVGRVDSSGVMACPPPLLGPDVCRVQSKGDGDVVGHGFGDAVVLPAVDGAHGDADGLAGCSYAVEVDGLFECPVAVAGAGFGAGGHRSAP